MMVVRGRLRAAVARLLPASLAMRTLLTLLAGLVLVQAAGLTIHALDRIELQRSEELRMLGTRAIGVFRSLAAVPAADRGAVLRDMDGGDGGAAGLAPLPQPLPDQLTPQALEMIIRANMAQVQMPAGTRPKDVIMRGLPWDGRVVIAMQFRDGMWLNLTLPVPFPRPWHSESFLLAFVLMTLAAGGLSVWAVRQLTGPVATLAAAAERLGRDVNAQPMPETGPAELVRAAVAFNTMAASIRRFVRDRTLLLTAIGHDLRTPITRLKLRVEFLEDPATREKFLADLDELDRMVSATLAFGRDTSDEDPAVPIDLGALLQTVLDEASDASPDRADAITLSGTLSGTLFGTLSGTLSGGAHVVVRGRALALKRAFANLVGNAIKYGNTADVVASVAGTGVVQITITDDGPGVAPDQVERVFDPFYRVEPSRNRETGGTGLGLSIARTILRAHGGDVVIGRAPGRGARVVVTLPN